MRGGGVDQCAPESASARRGGRRVRVSPSPTTAQCLSFPRPAQGWHGRAPGRCATPGAPAPPSPPGAHAAGTALPDRANRGERVFSLFLFFLTSARPGRQDLEQQHHERAQVGHVPHKAKDVHGGREFVRARRGLCLKAARRRAFFQWGGRFFSPGGGGARATNAGRACAHTGGRVRAGYCCCVRYQKERARGAPSGWWTREKEGVGATHPRPPPLALFKPFFLHSRPRTATAPLPSFKSSAPSGPPSGSARTFRKTARSPPNSPG